MATPFQETLSANTFVETSAFPLTYTPVSNTLMFFINGVFQKSPENYILSGSDVFTTELIPSGYNVVGVYQYEPEYPPAVPGTVIPAGMRGSTTLNPVITSFELLGERIKMQIGWPVVNIELCDDQIYDYINRGCEWYSKYAGLTEEYLVFDSCTYQSGYGLKLDTIINKIADWNCNPDPTTISPLITGQYYDPDLNNYRKVAGIFSLDSAGGGAGSGSGTGVLFNMDYMFAQQAYFGQMMGGMGFDMVTWHLLKSWLDDRKKLFATETYVVFDSRTQILKMIPEPGSRMGNSSSRSRFIGVLGVKMERSIAQLVKERWVQMYSLALTKQGLAHARGKYGGNVLFGGASVNATDLMTQGVNEQDKLEKELTEGYGEAMPPYFLFA